MPEALSQQWLAQALSRVANEPARAPAAPGGGDRDGSHGRGTPQRLAPRVRLQPKALTARKSPAFQRSLPFDNPSTAIRQILPARDRFSFNQIVFEQIPADNYRTRIELLHTAGEFGHFL